MQAQDVVLRDAGANPAAVAEVVRSVTGILPSAALGLVARPPCVIRARIAPALAEALRARLVAAGADVEVRAHREETAAPERFDVFLRDQGARKIEVVRAVRAMTGLELREAVELIERVPGRIKLDVARDEAERLVHELREAGAAAELRPHDASAAAPASKTVILAASADAGEDAGEDATGPFEVILHGCGPNKIGVIKVIRTVTGLGLKEAKDLAESSGVAVKRELSASAAAALHRQLVEIGAIVELRGDDRTPATTRPAAVDVVLLGCGASKISVIKLIREWTGLGLKEAKDLAETRGATVKAGVEYSEARAMERQLVEIGAVVELRAGEGEVLAADEPERVAVFLQSCGPNKILVIKELRAWGGFGLKEAKDLAEAAPCAIREDVDHAAAVQLQRALAEVGAVLELR